MSSLRFLHRTDFNFYNLSKTSIINFLFTAVYLAFLSLLKFFPLR